MLIIIINVANDSDSDNEEERDDIILNPKVVRAMKKCKFPSIKIQINITMVAKDKVTKRQDV